jgi:hypothetical protein
MPAAVRPGWLREVINQAARVRPAEPVVVAGGALVAIAPELRIVHPVGLAGRPGLPGAGLLWICASRACARVAGDLTGAGS